MSCGNFAAVRPKSHNNLILSFWLPVPAPWPRPSGFTTLRERCSEDSLAPFPHYRHYSPPIQLPLKCFVPPLGRAGLRPAPHALDRMAACQSWICFPLLQCHVFYGICAFVLRCFFSVLRLYSKWSIVWGLKKIFSASLPHVKSCIF